MECTPKPRHIFWQLDPGIFWPLSGAFSSFTFTIQCTSTTPRSPYSQSSGQSLIYRRIKQ